MSSNMPTFQKNLRLLIWEQMKRRKDFKRSKADILASILHISVESSQKVLDGNNGLNDAYTEKICVYFGVERELLINEKMIKNLSDDIIFRDNILFLMKSLAYGRQKDIGESTKVDNRTANRWASGKSIPSGVRLERFMVFMKDEFGFEYVDNIEKEAIFIKDWPLSKRTRIDIINTMLEAMDYSDLVTIYPALLKLLKRGD